MIETLLNVCWGEGLKLRRSRAIWMSAAAYAMAPVATAFLMLAAPDPIKAHLYGLTTLDAQITWVQADWPRFLDALAAASSVAGLIVFGLLMIWTFGREHSDQTSKELLTLPVPRETLVGGKILVMALWCMALQGGMLALALLLGASLRLPGWSLAAAETGLIKNFFVAIMTLCLAIPFGLIANLSRGVLGAVGALFLSLFFAIILTSLGWGCYFPWSIPALYCATPGLGSSALGIFNFCLVGLTGLAGIAGSMIWWRHADQR